MSCTSTTQLLRVFKCKYQSYQSIFDLMDLTPCWTMFSVMCVLTSILLADLRVHCTVTETNFHRKVLCDLNERLQNDCSQKASSVITYSLLRCVSLCKENNSCNGASLDENGHCFFHWICPSLDNMCIIANRNHHYVSKVNDCSIHGTWDDFLEYCVCDLGFTGTGCHQYPTDCDTYGALGSPSGFHRYHIDPDGDGLNAFYVLCDISPPSWYSVILLRNEGNTDFNRTYADYRRGFFIDEKNVWGGLDTWVALNEAGYKSVFVLNLKNGDSLYRIYKNLEIDATNGFRLLSYTTVKVAGKQSLLDQGHSFGDCLGLALNLRFSTWDHSGGGGGIQCAKVGGSGWWYDPDNCHNECNLMGWGFNHWATKTPYQLFSVPGLDMNSFANDVAFLEIYMMR